MQLLSRSLIASLLAVLLMSACSATARWTASPKDYDLYRRVRLADDLEERLRASARYLEQQPPGAWSAEVREWFEQAEDRYYMSLTQEPARLQRYLELLPQGKHAEVVRTQLNEVQRAQAQQSREEKLQLRRARAMQRQLARAASARRHFIEAFKQWTGNLIEIQSWGEPTRELSAQFLIPYRLREPAASCDLLRCSKVISYRYAVPSGRQLITRNAEVEVQLDLLRGNLRSGRVSGSELFTRLGEALMVSAVSAQAPLARAEAIAQVSQLVAHLSEDRFPADKCAREAISPVVLARECHGLRLEVVAGIADGEQDRVVVGALSE